MPRAPRALPCAMRIRNVPQPSSPCTVTTWPPASTTHHGEGKHPLSLAGGDGAGGDGDGLLEGEARDDVTKRHAGPLL